MLPSSIDENGQLLKDGELIADISCHISVSTRGKLTGWRGSLQIKERHTPKAADLTNLGNMDLKLENYQGTMFVTNQRIDDSGEITNVEFTGTGKLEEL